VTVVVIQLPNAKHIPLRSPSLTKSQWVEADITFPVKTLPPLVHHHDNVVAFAMGTQVFDTSEKREVKRPGMDSTMKGESSPELKVTPTNIEE